MNTKQRYFIELSFVGTHYHGWQIQKNAHSVQAELNAALSTLLQEEIATLGAGRTDTGVHAKQFFAHFDSIKHGTKEELTRWAFQLNCMLPKDIAILRIFPVDTDAHARFDAVSRTYKYVITQKKDPFMEEFACYLYGPLDMKKMNEAAATLKNYTDFSCFSKSRTQVKTNECTITHAEWKLDKNKQLIFTITANRFLRNMVRAIVGTLVDIGQGKLEIEDLHRIIEGKKRSAAGESMPACGLYLMEIKYPHSIVN
jgi:tRNA pseudouridine38-40 synthase